MTQNEPTEARQDELAGIGEKIAGIIDKAIIADMVSGQFGPTPYAQEILNLTVSIGGRKCDMCNGHGKILPYQLDNGSYIYKDDCPACGGTGHAKVVEKTIGEIIKEWEDGNDR